MHFEIYEGKDDPTTGQKGRWRWRLKENGRVIAGPQEGYVSHSECRKMVENIQKGCGSADILDPYSNPRPHSPPSLANKVEDLLKRVAEED